MDRKPRFTQHVGLKIDEDNGEVLVAKASGTFSIFRRKTDSQHWTAPAVSD